MIARFLLVFLGGGIGSVVRYLLGYLFSYKNLNAIYSTLVANIVSCIVIAFILAHNHLPKQLTHNQIFWTIGFCGGLSTFSTFSWQNWQLIQTQQWSLLSFNIAANLLLTILAIIIGLKLAS